MTDGTSGGTSGNAPGGSAGPGLGQDTAMEQPIEHLDEAECLRLIAQAASAGSRTPAGSG